MKTVILAGGIGKRVYPLSATKPKPMFRILGKPLIQHVIEILKEANLKDIIIVTGPYSEQIKNYFGDGSNFGVNIQYTHQRESLGMANAIEAVKGLVDDNFLVVNGDDIFEPFLIDEMIRFLKNDNSNLILACKPVKETWKFGILKIENDRVKKFVEKPPLGQEPSNLAVIGAYILPPNIFDYYSRIPVSDHQHEDAIQKFIDDGNAIRAVNYDGFFSAYKYPWDLFTINQYLMDKNIQKTVIEDDVEISEKAQVKGNVWIRKGVRILENAHVEGPCYIGENTIVGTNSLVRNCSSIGDNCIIGFSSEIKNSLIGDNCLFHTNYIGDSVIGDNCSFGSGAVTANFRFDRKTVKVKIDNNDVDSGRDKLGAVIGDNCQVGVNATILPGKKLGPNSIVGPGVCLQDDLETNKIIFLDRESYVIKENEMAALVEKKQELTKRLMK